MAFPARKALGGEKNGAHNAEKDDIGELLRYIMWPPPAKPGAAFGAGRTPGKGPRKDMTTGAKCAMIQEMALRREAGRVRPAEKKGGWQ